MSSRFGEMLLNRRRELGLSIQQVANVIKLRPQIIEYFELGNLAAMPPRGYAQGMIASYARYLGLNPREVVDAYFDELATYERVNNTGAGRFQDSVAEASPHSDNAAGRFMIVNGVPNSRYGQRPPQAGYVSESHSPHEPAPVSAMRPERGPHRLRYGQQRTLPPADGYGRGSDPRRARAQGYRERGAMQAPYRGRPAGYPAGGFSRSQNASRPMPLPGDQRRRAGGGRQGYNVNRGRRGSGGGASGGLAFDNRILLMLLAVALLLVVLVAALLLKSCGPDSSASNEPTVQVQSDSAGSSDSSVEEEDDADVVDASDSSSTDASASSDTDASGSQQTVQQETKVTISIAKGKTSWIEVKLDGQYVYSDTPVGPFEQEYTVTQSIEITVDNPADVVIKKNGEKVRYDSKSSGVGRVSITAPKVVADSDSDATSGQQTDTQTASGSDGDASLDSTSAAA